MNQTTKQPTEIFAASIATILDAVGEEHDREREIIVRRFGLKERRETLEQIGELLGITRERVRQLEKAIVVRLKLAAEAGELEGLHDAERLIIRDLSENGRVGRVSDITQRLLNVETPTVQQRAHIAFIGEVSARLTPINETDKYHQGLAIAEYGDEKAVRSRVDEIVAAIKQHGAPISLEALHDQLTYENPNQVRGLASLSTQLAHLKDMWGLSKWPTVNPKNIRDKIYVVLLDEGKPLHFSEIAQRIKESTFKRRNVTKQAIHNELIKDKRFILIGRGIYALDIWGYSQGTVADIIAGILRDEGGPLHRDEIVKRVLKSRQVKETTILLNLQSKPLFKRVAKATYALEPPKEQAEAVAAA